MTATIHTPSPWLRTIARHRLLTLTGTARRAARGSTILASLTPGALDPDTLTVPTCDPCRHTATITAAVHAGHYTPAGTPITLIVGLCTHHATTELPNLNPQEARQ